MSNLRAAVVLNIVKATTASVLHYISVKNYTAENLEET
jgi:hypothetical protein